MRPPAWAVALAVTLILEVPLVAALYPGQRKKLASFLANCATNLTLNLLLWRLPLLAGRHIVPGEALALLVEAAVYGMAGRPRDWPRALLASALANAASFFAGPFLAAWLLRIL